MKNAPDAEVQEYLLNVAAKDPKKIIDLYTGTDMTLRLLLIEAREKGVIVVKNKVFIYADDVVLGVSEDSVLAFLKDPKNKNILQLIKRDTFPELQQKNAEEDEEKPVKKTTKK